MEIYEEKDLFLSENDLPFTAFINRGSQEVYYHRHNFIELLYVVRGSTEVTIGSKVYKVSQGDFLIIHFDEIHHVAKGDWEILAIQFKPSMLNTALTELYENRYFISFIQKKTSYESFIRLSDGDDGIVKLLIEILDEFSSKQKGYELNIKGNIYKVFAWLVRKEYITIPASEKLNSFEVSRLKDILSYVQEHYGEKITDEMAAKISHMSYHYFCRTFKKATGKTFVEYVHFVRISEAEKLLALTDKSISEIALEVGFSSCSHFTRLFKNANGISPLSYRKAQSYKT